MDRGRSPGSRVRAAVRTFPEANPQWRERTATHRLQLRGQHRNCTGFPLGSTPRTGVKNLDKPT
jgi:hypothetical protein